VVGMATVEHPAGGVGRGQRAEGSGVCTPSGSIVCSIIEREVPSTEVQSNRTGRFHGETLAVCARCCTIDGGVFGRLPHVSGVHGYLDRLDRLVDGPLSARDRLAQRVQARQGPCAMSSMPAYTYSTVAYITHKKASRPSHRQ
jgi:hypothetical protein